MSATASAGTDFSKELLEETAGQKTSAPTSEPTAPERSFAESVQEAVDEGADPGWVMRRFHLTREGLRDLCPESVDDEEAWEAAQDGFGDSGY